MSPTQNVKAFVRNLGRPADAGGPAAKIPPWALPAAALLFSVVVMISLGPFWDNDINYIIALGRSIIAEGLPWTDPLTCNDGLQCIAQQWAFCVAAAWLYDSFGQASVIAMVCALWVCAAALMYRLAASACGSPRAASIGAAIALVALTPFIKTNPRPLDVIALLASVWAVQLWLESRSKTTGKAILLPVAISAAMANLHCTMWVLAAMPLACAFFDIRSQGRRGRLACALAAVVAASAASPYGISSTFYVFLSLGGGVADMSIAELQPPTFAYSMPLWLPFLAVCAILLAVRVRRRGWSRPTMRELLLLGFAILGFSQVRNMVLFWPVASIAMSCALAPILKVEQSVGEALARFGGIALLVVAPLCLMSVWWPEDSLWLENQRAEAIDALEDSGVEPGEAVCNSFGTGGWLELAGYKPKYDERAEMYLPGVNGGQDLASEMARYRLHYPDDLVARLSDKRYAACVFDIEEMRWYADALPEAGFEQVFENRLYSVWVKR